MHRDAKWTVARKINVHVHQVQCVLLLLTEPPREITGPGAKKVLGLLLCHNFLG